MFQTFFSSPRRGGCGIPFRALWGALVAIRPRGRPHTSTTRWRERVLPLFVPVGDDREAVDVFCVRQDIGQIIRV